MILTFSLVCFVSFLVMNFKGNHQFSKIIAIFQKIVHKLLFNSNNQDTHKITSNFKIPPGPKPWPFLGSLHIFAKFEIPFEAFSALSQQYGKIYSLRLGNVPCVVVNTYDMIKEVLIARGNDFGGRPDFIRYNKLFSGDRNNSLALCDWSQLQKTRRSIARIFCSPKPMSIYYETLNRIGCNEIDCMLQEITNRFQNNENATEKIKPLILETCANMFLNYMCSEKYQYKNTNFQQIVRRFDEIFWEINQGYALDFLPWLKPAYKQHLNKLRQWANDIRKFLSFEIIENRIRTIDIHSAASDFTDALLLLLEDDDTVNLQHILFELEDFVGGHSAIGNLVMIMINEVIKNPDVVRKIQNEIDFVTNRNRAVNLFDKPQMPYTEAIIFETLRFTSSPIVPHVATKDTHIQDYFIAKGTVIFLNNYDINISTEYWQEPHLFQPERFICPTTNRLVKPSYFIPFSTGKRTCIGQKLVQGFSFLIIASIFQNFNVTLPEKEVNNTKRCCMALPPDCFTFNFTQRPPTNRI